MLDLAVGTREPSGIMSLPVYGTTLNPGLQVCLAMPRSETRRWWQVGQSAHPQRRS